MLIGNKNTDMYEKLLKKQSHVPQTMQINY